MTKFGLSEDAFEKVCQALRQVSKLKRVLIFGSRAKGNYRPGSDIDLALEGDNLSFDDILSIRAALDNLMLPYKFDVVDRSHIDSELNDHINRVGVPIIKSRRA